MSKSLIVSTFPPKSCGIGTYAQEQMLFLKERGEAVYTLTFDFISTANYRVDFLSLKSMLKIWMLLLFSRFDKVYVHYAVEFYFPTMDHVSKGRKRLIKLAQAFGLFWIGLRFGKRAELIPHEMSISPNDSAQTRRLRAFALCSFRRIAFHTATELENSVKYFAPLVRRSHCFLVEHDRYMTPKFLGTQAEAREVLLLPKDKCIFLCIGFIQQHKGFHFAVEAMKLLDASKSKLYMVGSVRDKRPEYMEYLHHLESMCAELGFDKVEIVNTFVTDLQFDTWIRASDLVVLPYTEISSSGVGARAKVLKVPFVLNGNSNLVNQFSGETLKFGTTEQLQSIFLDFEKQRNKSRSGAQVAHAHKREGSSSYSKRILFVTSWFGKEVRGGAEKILFDFCCELAGRGNQVEVWSTATSRINGWNNEFLDGNQDLQLPFKVRRFKTQLWTESIFDRVHARMNQLNHCGVILRWIWKYTNLYGVGMRKALEREGNNFDTVFLCHYLSGTAHRLAGVFPQKTIVYPFIHQEAPLFNPIMRDLFASTRGVICNSAAEGQISLLSPVGLPPSFFHPIGNIVENVLPAQPNQPAERNIKKQLVYVGRLIPEKNLPLLVEWVCQYNRLNESDPVKLMLIGEGPLDSWIRQRGIGGIHCLGRLPAEEKLRVMQESIALVQLSLLESFSLVIMESWELGIPVLVHAGCAAASEHVANSNGGIALSGFNEFSIALEQLYFNRDLITLLGKNGKKYVSSEFSRDAVMNKMYIALNQIMNFEFPTKNLLSYSDVTTPKLKYNFKSVPNQTASPLEWNGQILLAELDQESKMFCSSGCYNFYVRYERAHRDGATIPESWAFYLEEAQTLSQSFLWIDVGAGRGSLLKYFISGGINKVNLFGVEPDLSSFVELINNGLNGCCMDALEFLKRCNSNSADVISFIHVAEHIPWKTFVMILVQCKRVLKQGGKLFVEVPNTLSIRTSATFFWMDPTHIKPLPPQTLKTFLESADFSDVSLKFFSPHLTTPQLDLFLQNKNLEDLVNDFYGKQDVVCLGTKVG